MYCTRREFCLASAVVRYWNGEQDKQTQSAVYGRIFECVSVLLPHPLSFSDTTKWHLVKYGLAHLPPVSYVEVTGVKTEVQPISDSPHTLHILQAGDERRSVSAYVSAEELRHE
jgi:hypothetical protein